MIKETIPIRVRSSLNEREHWAKKARRAKDERATAYLVLGPKFAAVVRRFPAVVRLTRVAPRPFDSDNLAASFKGIRDGVADRLGVNDGDPKVSWEYGQRRGKPKEYGVEIEISFSTGVSDAMPVV